MANGAPPNGRLRTRRLNVLRRRADHLERRIEENPERPAHHDRTEASALRWAIAELESKKGLEVDQ